MDSKNTHFLLERKDIYFYVAISLIFIGIAILSIGDYITYDESYSLLTTSKSAGHAYEKALLFELQPPLYYVFLSVWRDINSSIYFARLLSVVFLAISAFPIKALLKRLFGKRHQILTIIFLTNIVMLTYSLEIRYITLVLLWAAIIEYLFLTTYLSEKSKVSLRVLYVAVSILGVYTQYYFSFLLIANFLILLGLARKKMVKRYLIDMAWPVLSLVLLISYIKYQVSWSESHCSLEISIPLFFKLMYFHTKFLLISFFEPIKFFFLKLFPSSGNIIDFFGQPFTLGALAMTFIWVRRKSFINLTKHNIYQYILKSTILLIFFAFLAIQLNFTSLYLRYLVLLFIPVWIIIFEMMNLIRNVKIFYVVSYLLILSSLSFFTYNKIQHPKGHNNLLVSSHVMQNEGAGENIFVYKNYLDLVLKHSYEGKNTIFPIPEAITPEKNYHQIDWHISGAGQVDSILKRHYSDTIWLITRDNSYHESKFCVDAKDEILNQYVGNHFDLLSDKSFGEIHIQRLKWINERPKRVMKSDQAALDRKKI
jgi:hypothetical protein